MIVIAIALIAVGIVTGLLGAKLFRLLLPVLGLVTGFVVGYTGFQGIFGTSAVSTAMAVVIALIVGLLLGVLAYMFFDIAVVFFAIAIGAMALSYLGVALGLRQDGVIVFLLGVAGAILGGSYALKNNLGLPLVLAVTSLLGVAYVLAGIMLVAGEVDVKEISEAGVVSTLLRVVDQSFLWLLVWIGGSLITVQLQKRLLMSAYGSDAFAYKEVK